MALWTRLLPICSTSASEPWRSSRPASAISARRLFGRCRRGPHEVQGGGQPHGPVETGRRATVAGGPCPAQSPNPSALTAGAGWPVTDQRRRGR
jgi:hypothetical protein